MNRAEGELVGGGTRFGAEAKQEFLLDPAWVFLNHGSFGACPRAVLERSFAWQRELERQPVEFMQRRHAALLRAAREALARFLGTETDRLVYVSNATAALNTVAASLGSVLRPGDEILMSDQEYGAMLRMWRRIAERYGLMLREQRIRWPATEESILEDLWHGTTERTRVLFCSHLTSPTALRFPVERLAKRCREAGILSVIDGSHAPGQIPLDLDSLGADFYAGNCHKWMLAPKGSGFLWASREAAAGVEPLVVSWGEMADSGERMVRELEYQGTRDPAAWLSTPAAIEFLEARGWAGAAVEAGGVLRRWEPLLLELWGGQSVYWEEAVRCPRILSLRLPEGTDPAAFQDALRSKHRIEIPVFRAGGASWLRVSYQIYNSERDLETLREGLREALG